MRSPCLRGSVPYLVFCFWLLEDGGDAPSDQFERETLDLGGGADQVEGGPVAVTCDPHRAAGEG